MEDIIEMMRALGRAGPVNASFAHFSTKKPVEEVLKIISSQAAHDAPTFKQVDEKVWEIGEEGEIRLERFQICKDGSNDFSISYADDRHFNAKILLGPLASLVHAWGG